jgi:NAD(P)-dependent dehydrogenase (short-subunit alcohol dehydrogenase family)
VSGGPVVLVTGASRRVGAATAVALAAAGYRVAGAARSTATSPQRTPGTLDQTVAAIEAAGGEAVAIPTNLAAVDEVAANLPVQPARKTAAHCTGNRYRSIGGPIRSRTSFAISPGLA